MDKIDAAFIRFKEMGYPEPGNFDWIDYGLVQLFVIGGLFSGREGQVSASEERKIYGAMYRLARERQGLFANPEDVWNICKDFRSSPESLPQGKDLDAMQRIKEDFLREVKREAEVGNSVQGYVDEVAGKLSEMSDWNGFVLKFLEDLDATYALNCVAAAAEIEALPFKV